MTQRTKLTIFNAALTRTGNEPVGENEGTMISKALEANYDEIVRAAFEEGEYPFGKKRVTLTSRAIGDFGYDDAFVFPSAIFHVTDVFLNGHRAADLIEAWDIDASVPRLLINAKARKVEIEGLKAGLEHTWSGKFTLAVQRRLEAVVKDVIEEFDESSAKDSDADFQFMKASVKGSKNRSRRKFRGAGRLVRAHTSSRRR